MTDIPDKAVRAAYSAFHNGRLIDALAAAYPFMHSEELERLRALNAELVAALSWAFPLAALELENNRQRRLQYGHDDIGAGSDHLGLHESEYEALRRARAAIAKAKEQR